MDKNLKPLKIAPGIGERLASVRGTASREEFAVKLGMKHITYSSYETGTRKVPLELLKVVREQCGADLNWLVTGIAESDDPAGLGTSRAELSEAVLTDVLNAIFDWSKATGIEVTNENFAKLTVKFYKMFKGEQKVENLSADYKNEK